MPQIQLILVLTREPVLLLKRESKKKYFILGCRVFYDDRDEYKVKMTYIKRMLRDG